jgi:putative two-component system response regulator
MLTPAYAAPASDETLVLILDSDPAVAEFLADYLSEHGMHPLACLGLSQACDLLTTQPDIRLAVVDINHQPGGGLAAVDELLMERPHLQVIYLSSMSTGQPGEWQRALDQGAHDIIAKPLNGPRLLAALDRAVSALRDGPQTSVEQRTSRLAALIGQSDKEDCSDNEVIAALSSCAADYDPDGRTHCQRVGLVAETLAKQAGIDPTWSEQVGRAASLHDLGMIGLAPELLERAHRPLTSQDISVLRSHTALGHSLLTNSQRPLLQLAAEIALSHHEHWDGSGYPLGLQGPSIPLSGRLTMLANAYDRLRSERHISHQKVVDLLQNGTDGVPPSHFDPDLLASLSPNEDCFIGLYGHSAP